MVMRTDKAKAKNARDAVRRSRRFYADWDDTEDDEVDAPSRCRGLGWLGIGQALDKRTERSVYRGGLFHR